MKILAGLLAVLGVILLLVGINMDTSVSTGGYSSGGGLYGSSYSLPSRVNNNGLMQQQLMTVLGGLAALLGAVVALGAGVVADAVRPKVAPPVTAQVVERSSEAREDEVPEGGYQFGAPVEDQRDSGSGSTVALIGVCILVVIGFGMAFSGGQNRPVTVNKAAEIETAARAKVDAIENEATGTADRIRNMSSAGPSPEPTPRRHR